MLIASAVYKVFPHVREGSMAYVVQESCQLELLKCASEAIGLKEAMLTTTHFRWMWLICTPEFRSSIFNSLSAEWQTLCEVKSFISRVGTYCVALLVKSLTLGSAQIGYASPKETLSSWSRVV